MHLPVGELEADCGSGGGSGGSADEPEGGPASGSVEPLGQAPERGSGDGGQADAPVGWRHNGGGERRVFPAT